MQPQSSLPTPTLLPIPTLNIQPPNLKLHQYTLYHQKKHMMLINGQQEFNSESEQISSKHKTRDQDFTSTDDNSQDQTKLINVTLLKRCERCMNWILQSEMSQHMTFHAAIILENLFLGDKFSSQSRKELIQRLQVTHVVNAASELPNVFVSEGISYFNLTLFDILQEDVIGPCLKAAEFMETVFCQGGRVFVHCAMGRSRSVAVILVYLMNYKGLSLKESLSLVKEKRNIVKPNPSYMKQLETFEEMLRTEKTSPQTTNYDV